MNKDTNNKKGFGLLEVLVSMVIIITILSALVFVGRASLRNSDHVQQRAQAIYLAQEGIEKVRQIRDTNWIDGNNATQWDSWLLSNGSMTGIKEGDYKLNNSDHGFSLVPFSQGDEEKINLDNVDYKRIVKVSRLNNTVSTEDSPKQSWKVTAIVSFDSGVSGNVEVSEILTNWRPNY